LTSSFHTEIFFFKNNSTTSSSSSSQQFILESLLSLSNERFLKFLYGFSRVCVCVLRERQRELNFMDLVCDYQVRIEGKKKFFPERERESCLQSNNREIIQVTSHQTPISLTRTSSRHPWSGYISIPCSYNLQQSITCIYHNAHDPWSGQVFAIYPKTFSKTFLKLVSISHSLLPLKSAATTTTTYWKPITETSKKLHE
jgi:hypothetical protein